MANQASEKRLEHESKIAESQQRYNRLLADQYFHQLQINDWGEHLSRIQTKDRIPSSRFLSFILGQEVFEEHMRNLPDELKGIECNKKREAETRKHIAQAVRKMWKDSPKQKEAMLAAVEAKIREHRVLFDDISKKLPLAKKETQDLLDENPG
ncbi:MAG: hypothetical protein WC408_03180 [Candidatus Micrarchaeia archaeon]